MKQTVRRAPGALLTGVAAMAAVLAAMPAIAQSGNTSKPAPSGPAVVDASGEVAKAPMPEKTAESAAPPAAAPAVQSSPLNTPPPQQPPRPKNGRKKDAAKAEPAPAAPAAVDQPYVIGPLDVIEIRVWDNTKLSGMYDVGPDGMISMYLLGQVKADGLTIPQLMALLKKKLSDFMDEPEVNIQVVKYNSKRITIIGGCLHQGEMPLIAKTTVLEALANCGGFRDFANVKKIKIFRGNQKFDFNYKDALQNKHPEQNIYLENGDRIVIPE